MRFRWKLLPPVKTMLDRSLTEPAGRAFLGWKAGECAHEVIKPTHPYNDSVRELAASVSFEDSSLRAQAGTGWEWNVEESFINRAKHQGSTEANAENAFDAIREVLANAVEHGSNFGERGSVEFIAWASRRGIFSIVADPGPGFDLRRLPAYQKQGRVLPLSSHEAEHRGQGSNLLLDESVRVNFEKNRRRFRVLMLFGQSANTSST
jgi:anti-sigma regulatory factor (Ser/Thr protein kinase)